MAKPSPFDIPGEANSLADAIRQQASNQSRISSSKKHKKSGAPSNPLDQLMQQINSINVQPTPYDVLLQQATGAAGAQFDPLISELQAQMDTTTKRGHSNEKEARSMYNALASDIGGELPQITQQMAAASKDTENRYNDTQGQLNDQYKKQAADQAALYKKLGIQAATPDASQQSMDDQAYFQQQSKSDEASALATLNEMKNSDVAYNQQSADNTRLAGVNTSQDIASQLEDYLQQAGGKMSGLRAGRDSAVQQMLAQLEQQDSSRVGKEEDTQYNHLMDMFNLQLKMQQMQQKSGADKSLFKGTSGPAGASNYLGGVYGANDSFSSGAIMDAINDVMASPEAVAGKYQSQEMKDQYGNPKTIDTNPNYLIDLLRSRLTKGDSKHPLSNPSFSNADVNNAINALLAYLGKLK